MAKAATRGQGRRKSSRRKASAAGGGMVLWGLAGVLAIGGIVAHDNWNDNWNRIAPILSTGPAASSARPSEPKKQVAQSRPAALNGAGKPGALPVPPAPILIAAVPAAKPAPQPAATPVSAPAAAGNETIAIKFGFCGQGAHRNCVDDGRTFFHDGGSIVLADIETPSADRPKCDSERQLGIAAKIRLLSLLNSGPFTVKTTGGEKAAFRDGRSLGAQLVTEGLARPAAARPANWCA